MTDTFMRAAPPSSQVPVLDDGWRKWIAENLVLGASHESILSTLTSKGFGVADAQREVSAAADSPYVHGSQRLYNRLRKREWLLESYRRLNRQLPAGDVVDVRRRLPRDVFLKDYYTANRPVVIKGMLDDWPALQTWTPGLLRKRFGTRQVEVQMGRSRSQRYEVQSSQLRTMMPFADYVDLVVTGGDTNDYYMTANNSSANYAALKELWDDIIQIPEYLEGNLPQKGFFWFGPQGTITPFHHDLTNNFMAQVYGRKLVKLIPACDLPHVYNEFHCYTDVDAENVDWNRFPDFANCRVIDCLLEPGDLLFLPVGWWHYVKGLEISMTMTFTNFLFDNDFHTFYNTYHEV